MSYVRYNLMRLKIYISLVLAFMALGPLMARIVQSWTYQEMFDKADLVVIAKVVSTKDTDERSTLLDLNVVGVVTEFKSHLILKGPKGVTTFQLHHYRLESENDENVVNGPDLIRIVEHRAFLLFLTREHDGRYAPVTGQTDPGGLSVLELKSVAD
jgi:hypothetical protein